MISSNIAYIVALSFTSTSWAFALSLGSAIIARFAVVRLVVSVPEAVWIKIISLSVRLKSVIVAAPGSEPVRLNAKVSAPSPPVRESVPPLPTRKLLLPSPVIISSKDEPRTCSIEVKLSPAAPPAFWVSSARLTVTPPVAVL